MRLIKLLRAVPFLLLSANAFAQFTYAQQLTTIRAGVVLLGGNQTASVPPQSSNTTPFVWYNLDRSPVKPAGWTFLNPLAATQGTQAIVDRWNALGLVVGGPTTLTSPFRLTKSEAAYWEVQIAGASDQQLAQFDVLAVSIYDMLTLTPYERERLRRFVDQGGVLWVDISTAVSALNQDLFNNLPLPIAVDNSAGSGAFILDNLNPIFNRPYVLTVNDALYAQTSTAGHITPVPPSFAIEQTLPADFSLLSILAADSTGPFMTSGRIGDGYVFVTARGVALAANRSLVNGVYQPNNQFYALGPSYDNAALAADRLLVNAISLPTSRVTTAGGSRGNNGAPVDVGAPMLKRFDVNLTAGTQGSLTNYPPALYKGLLVVTNNDGSGSSQILVYNAKPGADINGTGVGDKGISDFKYGQPMDLIWKSQMLPGPISAPTCIHVNNPQNNYPMDQIVVTVTPTLPGNPEVYAFDAYAKGQPDLTMVTPAYTVQPSTGSSAGTSGLAGAGPYAPTYHEGLLFVADSQGTAPNPIGRVFVVNPATGLMQVSGGEWVVGGGASGGGINEISASPTVGYIPIQDNSGGVDKVVYVPTRPKTVTGAANTSGLTSLWFGARGEQPVIMPVANGANTQLPIQTRASYKGLDIYQSLNTSDPLGFKLTVLGADGKAWSQAKMSTYFAGSYTTSSGGYVTVDMNGVALPTDPLLDSQAVVGFRIDYTIDWGSNLNNTASIIRGQLNFPDNSTGTRRVIGNVALSPAGNIFVVVSSQDTSNPGGDLYALSEVGRGTFKLLYRYTAYDQFNYPVNNSVPVPYRELFADNDGITTFAAALQGPISKLTFTSPPAVKGDVVYVTAKGLKGPFLFPVTVVMALKDNPLPPEIRVSGVGGDSSLQVVQPDLTRSTDRSNPDVQNVLFARNGQVSFSQEPQAPYGTIHFDASTGVMGTPSGPVVNALASNMPVTVRVGNNDQFIEPNASGGTWSPLLWYACLNGYSNSSSPVVTGNTLFLAGNSSLPSILSGAGFSPKGLLFAMNSDIGETDPLNVDDALRNWQVQVPTLKVSPSFQVNPNMRWPQVVGATDVSGYTLRLLQTVLDANSKDATGVVAGEGTVASIGSEIDSAGILFGGSPYQALHVFGLADFIVADEGRLGRFDSSGNVLFSSDTSFQSGPDGDTSNVGDIHPLVRPVRAYPLSSTDMVVADPGSNRVARMSLSGHEIRSFDTFILDTTFRPDGFNTNESLRLDHPSDVQVYTEYVTAPNNPFVGPQATEYWIHYIIADTSNRRLLDLVDRFSIDATSGDVLGPLVVAGAPQVGVLYRHSPAVFSGKQWNYNAVSRVFVPASGAYADRYVLAAAFGSATVTPAGSGLALPNSGSQEEAVGNGGIVVFDPAGDQVISEVSLPAENANLRFDYPSSSFMSQARIARKKKLSGLTSVTMANVPVGSNSSQLAIMFTDASGVYEILPDGAGGWAVDWMLPNDAYQIMRTVNAPFGGPSEPTNQLITDGLGAPIVAPNPLGLRAMFARRLASREVLIVNGYTGELHSGDKFYGEVIQVNGDTDPTGNMSSDNTLTGFSFNKVNFGFGVTSLRYVLPPTEGTRGLRTPVFADRR